MSDTTLGKTVGHGILSGGLVTVIMLVIYVIVQQAMSGPSASGTIILSFVAAGLAGGILQQLWFVSQGAMRFSYPTRIFGFGSTYLIVLVGCAVWGAWLPVHLPMAWVEFVITYLVILGIMTLVMGAVFKRRGADYTARLDEYHARRRQD
ncbi:hypothetical protein [Olsenella massiliensis]|uniref:hypothetical protein n=1 Tax=Olsenella massiliensis TaxID=1622075 RepID=UPI00071DCCD3|nr:hypothetical protein [Olsenella massiliensis]